MWSAASTRGLLIVDTVGMLSTQSDNIWEGRPKALFQKMGRPRRLPVHDTKGSVVRRHCAATSRRGLLIVDTQSKMLKITIFTWVLLGFCMRNTLLRSHNGVFQQ